MEYKNSSPDRHSEFESFVNKRMNMQEEEQMFEAGLLIERIEEIDTDKAYNNTKQTIDKRTIPIGWFQQFSKYAAILAIPLFFAFCYSLYLNLKQVKQETVAYELTCPPGNRTQATLPDGTKAVSYTHLTLPTNREV